MSKSQTKSIRIWVIFVWILAGISCKNYESASYKRFGESKLRYEKYNEFNTQFQFTKITGIGYEEGVTRRDPSSIIKVDSLYYVWYTRPPSQIPVVGRAEANDTLRAYHWDLAEVWYATSPDGHNWTEKGVAVARGPKESFDGRSVFTADVLVANGKYYLFYQAAGSLEQGRLPKTSKLGGDFLDNKIGMSWANSPDGPWYRWETPILGVGPPDDWDGNVVHDPSLIVREGKYWLYYKSSPRSPFEETKEGEYTHKYANMRRSVIGVAIANRPEGPYIKSKYNPVLIGGHEVIVWPYRKGVCAFLTEGPERNSIQYAEDGINFYPVMHGLQIPEAGGVYRAGNFTDTEVQPGQGITWGLHHKLGQWNYLERFDCNLSLQKGDSINAEYRIVEDWMRNKKK